MAIDGDKISNSTTNSYKKGLLYFCGLIVCITAFFTMPDGVALFHGFLGLFGIPPGIPFGSNSTLYIYMAIPLVVGIFCYKKMRRHWREYGEQVGTRFGDWNFLRRLPVFIGVVFLLFASDIVRVSYPPPLDRVYFAVLRQQGGLRAVTFRPGEQLRYESEGNYRTYFYDFQLWNYGRETAVFYVKLEFEDIVGVNQVFILDHTGEPKTFILPSNPSPFGQRNFRDNFTVEHICPMNSGSFWGGFSVILVNDNETHHPSVLVR